MLRSVLLVKGRFLSALLLRVTITGRENLPQTGPLIVISNHFSWFEVPLLAIHLPYHVHFLAATELQEKPIFHLLAQIFDAISIWRGKPDRQALKKAQDILNHNGIIGIFPEGGIDPDLRDRVNAGETISQMRGHAVRRPAVLIPPRPGAAYLAVRSGVPVLPVAFSGTENILHNLSQGRRTPVQIHIGPSFDPITLPRGISRAERRTRIDAFGNKMMEHLAVLLPPEYRGPFS